MAIDYTEKGLETNIEDCLVQSGYRSRRINDNALDDFKKHAIDVEILFEFLESSQPKEIERLRKVYKEQLKTKILERLNHELNSRGMIDCIRHGIKDYGVTLKLAFNQPVSYMNQTLTEMYKKNIFTISRQVYYSSNNNNSIDMLVLINGLPIAVLELKNPLTIQTVDDAKRQYMNDRDPKELLFQFKKRAIVFFAVDPDEVYMTTHLDKAQTFFLPFNKGNNGGKGNPIVADDYKTSYLWRETLNKNSLIEILFRFVFVKQDDIKDSTGEVIDKERRSSSQDTTN